MLSDSEPDARFRGMHQLTFFESQTETKTTKFTRKSHNKKVCRENPKATAPAKLYEPGAFTQDDLGKELIYVYDEYQKRLPADLKGTDALFLAPITAQPKAGWSSTPIWFSRSRLGVHTISTFVQHIIDTLDKDFVRSQAQHVRPDNTCKYTTYSLRVTTITELRGLPDHQIRSITGHRSNCFER